MITQQWEQGVQVSADSEEVAAYFHGHVQEVNYITFLMQHIEILT